MRYSFVALCVLGAFAARPASALSVMIGRGTGHECYLATLTAPSADGDVAALAACNQAVAAYPDGSFNQAASLVNRSEIFIRQGRFRDALADCDRALAISPDLPAAYTNRGAGLVGLAQYSQAVAALDRAIALGGTRLEIAYYNRGLAEDYEGDVAGAYRDYRKSLELNPGFAPPKDQLPRFKVTSRTP